MPANIFFEYAPEFMLLLFFATFALGLIVRYFLNSSKRNTALGAETKTSQLKKDLLELRGTHDLLKEQQRVFE